MIPFYFIDGPLKGRTFLGTFCSQDYEGSLYKKGTYHLLHGEYELYCDVAYVKQPTTEVFLPDKNWFFNTPHIRDARLIEHPEVHKELSPFLQQAKLL